jgi:Uma2 family endonuclease
MSSGAPQVPKRPATLADLLALPEEERWELVDGQLIQKEAASPRHGRAQSGAIHLLHGPYRRRPGGPPDRPGGWWFSSETLIDFGGPNARIPDVAGWRMERLPELPDEGIVRVLPDWICAVLSTNRADDPVRKKRLSHRCKIPHYWIIDPRDEILTVLRWTPDGYTEVLAAERGERVRAEPFDAIELQVGVLFGDDEE